MKHLSSEEFDKYINDNCKKMIYLVNPHVQVAYRSKDSTDGKSCKTWCKPKGCPEFEVDGKSEESFEAFLFREVLAKEEYDNY